MGFELTTPVFERANTVHSLDRAAAVIGSDLGLLLLTDNSVLYWKLCAEYDLRCLTLANIFNLVMIYNLSTDERKIRVWSV
jgi:hypothetical protein